MRFLPAVLALVLALSACSSDAADDDREPTAREPVARQVSTNPDRDAAEVEQKLAALDPCSLFTAEAAQEVGDDLDTRDSNTPQDCWIGADDQVQVQVDTGFDDAARYALGRHEAAGAVSYRTSTERSSCTVTLPVSQTVGLAFSATYRSCDDVVRYAEGAARLLREDPASATRDDGPDEAPVDLLLPWSEEVDDVAAVGACAHLLDALTFHCIPAGEADVPTDPIDRLEVAEADPDVLCAVAAPVVREHLGDEFVAVTMTEGGDPADPTLCAFEEPSHAVHLKVRVDTGTTDLPGSATGAESLEIAGHPAARTHTGAGDGDEPRGHHYVILREDGSPGTLRVDVTVTSDRYVGNSPDAPVDTAPLEQAEAIATGVTEALFG